MTIQTFRDTFLNTFEADTTVKVEGLPGSKLHRAVLEDVHHILKYKYGTILDKDKGIIYVENKV